MKEHVPEHRGKVRNTCIKNTQIVHCVIVSVGHIVNPIFISTPAMVCGHQMTDCFGVSQKKHTVAYIGIKLSRALVKNAIKFREWMQGS
jgi:hypothetical protein